MDCISLSPNSYSLILNGKTHYITVNPLLNDYEVKVDHHTHLVHVKDELEVLLEQFVINNDSSKQAGLIYAQIPGLVSQIFIREGDSVKVNQKLFILESMKMENEIDSPISGLVDKIYVKSDDKVKKGDLIMEITN